MPLDLDAHGIPVLRARHEPLDDRQQPLIELFESDHCEVNQV